MTSPREKAGQAQPPAEPQAGTASARRASSSRIPAGGLGLPALLTFLILRLARLGPGPARRARLVLLRAGALAEVDALRQARQVLGHGERLEVGLAAIQPHLLHLLLTRRLDADTHGRHARHLGATPARTRQGAGPAPGGLGHFRRRSRGNGTGAERTQTVSARAQKQEEPAPSGLGYFRRHSGGGGASTVRGGCRAQKIGTGAVYFSALIFDRNLVSCPVLNITSPLVPHGTAVVTQEAQAKGKYTLTLPLNYRLNSVVTPMKHIHQVLPFDTIKKAAADYSHIYS